MTDCNSPKCHEGITSELGKLVSKKTVWVFLAVIGIPLLVTGVQVWSQQEADYIRFAQAKIEVDLKYATKESVEECKRQLVESKTIQRNILEDLEDLKEGQREASKDIKEVLKYLRDKK